MEKRLCWIFGSPKSGSTWLLKMLADHDRIVPINEPQIGLHLAPFVSDWPGWYAADLGENFTFNRAASAFHIYFFSRQHEKVWSRSLRKMICRRFAVYGDRRSLLAIKEPNGSQAADVILRALPRSRLLFLLRDGRDVVDSELASASRGSWMSGTNTSFRGIDETARKDFVVQAAHKWVWRTQVVQEAFGAHSGPKLLIRYEELLDQTDREMDRVIDWLGLSSHALAGIVERHRIGNAHQRGPQEFIRSASPGSWQENLTQTEQALVEEILGPKLREMGYVG